MVLPLFEIAFDCADPYRVADFWRVALDYVQQMPTAEELEAAYQQHPEWRDIAIVEDELARHPRLYLQRVREPKVGRNRITFELTLPGPRSDEIDRLVALGARVLDDDWLSDPEGNEFQVLSGGGPRRFSSVVIDALDPERLARFWGEIFDFMVDGDRCVLEPGAVRSESGELVFRGRRLGVRLPGAGTASDGPLHEFTPGLRFRKTSERKIRKNRIHFDLLPTEIEADRANAFARGAVPERVADTGHRGMFDPEGNEFCLHTDEMFDQNQ